ncbi:MAG: 3-hydroxyacyl-CoA dehydrogenase NAD-binding domain-containing protein [Cyclobacteriaceae bacterium]|jgi:3-hydroxybutyryl-CoA dehydrogenase|nr:3-hydroxyacyl-CoA dehydrogenase NAD-binding domain-containing protein [Flammeovirgaceae bacterium]
MTQSIQTVAVVGAGTMGQGIAQVCAMSGYKTILFDIDSNLSEKALSAINQNLNTAVAKGKLTEETKQRTIESLTTAKDISELKVDLVIEAVVERLEVKQQLFAQLESINQGQCILASNTSSISITQIASALKQPKQCVGLHFFNPAHLMKLVEVVNGVATDLAVVLQMKTFVQSLSKITVETKDSPGFIVNRVARHYYVEALKLLEEGVADEATIDNLMRSAGFKMGPFELMDLIGIDINFAVTSSLYQSFFQDSKFRPSRIQQQKVLAGHLGRKTGKGFYEYGR